MINAMPSTQVRDDATCLLVFTGSAHRAVKWSISGTGSLEILTEVTDANGSALAKYIPGTAGATATVTVKYSD